jgi:hypothetical protein
VGRHDDAAEGGNGQDGRHDQPGREEDAEGQAQAVTSTGLRFRAFGRSPGRSAGFGRRIGSGRSIGPAR